MKLPFEKKVLCGNYYVIKRNRKLSGKEAKKLQTIQGLPSEIQEKLTHNSLPYISVGTISGSWKIEFIAGMSMYNALDEIPVALDSEGKLTYYGDGYRTLGNIFNGWMAYTSTVGDTRYQNEVLKAMQDYIDRASAANSDPLPDTDNAEVLDDAVLDEESRQTLLDIHKQMQKEAGNEQ